MEPTQKEKVLAITSHLSLLLSPLGLLLTGLIYFLNRESVSFVARHAGQALGFQLAVVLVGFVVGLNGFGMLFKGLVYGLKLGLTGVFSPALIFWFTLFLVVLCAVVGAYRALIGKDFQYPLVGELIQRFI